MNNLNGLLKPEELLKKAEAFARGEIELNDLSSILEPETVAIPQKSVVPVPQALPQRTYIVSCPHKGCLTEVANPSPTRVPLTIKPYGGHYWRVDTEKHRLVHQKASDMETINPCQKCQLGIFVYWKY